MAVSGQKRQAWRGPACPAPESKATSLPSSTCPDVGGLKWIMAAYSQPTNRGFAFLGHVSAAPWGKLNLQTKSAFITSEGRRGPGKETAVHMEAFCVHTDGGLGWTFSTS